MKKNFRTMEVALKVLVKRTPKGQGIKNIVPPRRLYSLQYKTFPGYYFSCNKIGHKVMNCDVFDKNNSAINKVRTINY